MMQTVLLHPNPTKLNALQITKELIAQFCADGYRVLIRDSIKALLCCQLGARDLEQVTFLPDEQAFATCDFVLVIGGDGTMLKIAGDAARHQKPILGVNVGTLGFMTEINIDELPLLRRIRSGDYRLENRMMLDATVLDAAGQETFAATVLNEVVVTKGVVSKVIRLAVDVNGEQTIRFSGDGVIVCTPTGSTAYSLAAGGPILGPGCACIAVTPICAHSFHVKSFVVSSQEVITILPDHRNQRIFLSPDGFASHELQPGDQVVIKQSQKQVSLLRLKNQGFYEVISEKLSK